MVTIDDFRQDLTGLLLRSAERRRRVPGRQRSGEDIKAAALLERLAADAKNLDRQVFLAYQAMLAQEGFARRLRGRRDGLLAQVGVIYCPADASDMVRWMCRQASADDEGVSPEERTPSKPAGPSAPADVAAMPRQATHRALSQHGRSMLVDFCAGIGIVGPMLSVWQVKLAIGQWRDLAASQRRPAVPASILSQNAIGGDRVSGLSSRVVLTFAQSATAPSCQVSVRVAAASLRQSADATTMVVVPRSDTCEPPVILSELANPDVTLAFAALLMAAGLVALKAWGRLDRKGFGRFHPAGS